MPVQLMELGPAETVITKPLHPYTRGLLRSLPYLVPKGSPLIPIPGNVPDLAQLSPGCPFSPRCDVAANHLPGTTATVGGSRSRPCRPLLAVDLGRRAPVTQILVAVKGLKCISQFAVANAKVSGRG
jgi:oligopeptide/dipeptide ABC transporter ATP-binding protein